MSKFKLLTLNAIFVLAGCSLASDYRRPALSVPRQFSLSQNSLVSTPGEYQDTGWRVFFVSDQVEALIGEALVNNRNLHMATPRVQEARAQCGVMDTGRCP